MDIVIKLSVPIKSGTEEIAELKIRPAKAKDLRDLPLDPKVGDILDVAGKLAAQPPSVMNELSPSDLGEVLKAVGEFVGGGPAIGKSASGS